MSTASVAASCTSSFKQEFPVIENGNVLGVLTRSDIVKALAGSGPQAFVGDTMQRQFETADASESAETALARLQGCECRTMPFLRDGKLAGYLPLKT